MNLLRRGLLVSRDKYVMLHKLRDTFEGTCNIPVSNGYIVAFDYLITETSSTRFSLFGKGGTGATVNISYNGVSLFAEMFISTSYVESIFYSTPSLPLNTVMRVELKVEDDGSGGVDLTMSLNGSVVATKNKAARVLSSNMTIFLNDNTDTVATNTMIANVIVRNAARTQTLLDVPLQGDFSTLAGSLVISGIDGVDYEFVEQTPLT